MLLISQLIDEIINIDLNKYNKKVSGYYSPSSIVYFYCPFQFFLFKLFGNITIFDKTVKASAFIGNNIHEILQGILNNAKQLNKIKKHELEIWLPNNDFLIKGRLDSLITDNRNKIHLLEIKTSGKDKFFKLKNPIKEHEKQVLLYAYLLKQYSNTKIDYIHIIYFNRDATFKKVLMKEFIVDYDELKIVGILKTITDVIDNIREKKIPKKICNYIKTENVIDKLYNKYRTNCQYKDICPLINTYSDLTDAFIKNQIKYNFNIDTLFKGIDNE